MAAAGFKLVQTPVFCGIAWGSHIDDSNSSARARNAGELPQNLGRVWEIGKRIGTRHNVEAFACEREVLDIPYTN